MKNAAFKACTGGAHSPAIAGHIDHCMMCAPRWGKVAVCWFCTFVDYAPGVARIAANADANAMPSDAQHLRVSKSGRTGTCPQCNTRYAIARGA